MHTNAKLILTAAVFATLALGAAWAEHTPASQELKAANDAMHHAMTVELTDDPDIDFAQAMIPHHEGAVAMAEIVLKYGSDPEIRKLAEAVVSAQRSEIDFMKAWLEKKGVATGHGAH